MVEYSSVRCRRVLSPSGLPGLDYALNPYIGCEHGCAYCYSPAVLRRRDYLERWGEFVMAKENFAELLAEEVRGLRPGCIGVGTVCDPYQPVERSLCLTRRALEVLRGKGFSVCIQTKSSLVLRDMDLLDRRTDEVGVTITTMDGDLARRIEPRASPPDDRAGVLEELANRDVTRWLFLGPVIPGVNDSGSSLAEVIEVARKTGSQVIYDRLNLKLGVAERLSSSLGNSSFLSALTPEWWERKSAEIERLCRERDVRCEPAFRHALGKALERRGR
jgi:DNA repair photolyase